MRGCRREIAKIERLRLNTDFWRVTLDEVNHRHRKGPLFEVHLVVGLPGGELIVYRTPPKEATEETVETALRSAFTKIRRRLTDYGKRRAHSNRRQTA